AVVPAAVEDHHFAAGRKMLDVALHVQHRAVALAGSGQGDDSEGAGADPLGQPLDHAPLAGGVAAFANDDHAGAGLAHPVLQVANLDLELLQLLLIVLAGHLVGLAIALGFCGFLAFGLIGSGADEILGLDVHRRSSGLIPWNQSEVAQGRYRVMPDYWPEVPEVPEGASI